MEFTGVGKVLNFHTVLLIKSFRGGNFSPSSSSSEEESYVGSLIIIDFFGRIGKAVETWTKRIWFGSSFGGGVISIFGTFLDVTTGSANLIQLLCLVGTLRRPFKTLRYFLRHFRDM